MFFFALDVLVLSGELTKGFFTEGLESISRLIVTLVHSMSLLGFSFEVEVIDLLPVVVEVETIYWD